MPQQLLFWHSWLVTRVTWLKKQLARRWNKRILIEVPWPCKWTKNDWRSMCYSEKEVLSNQLGSVPSETEIEVVGIPSVQTFFKLKSKHRFQDEKNCSLYLVKLDKSNPEDNHHRGRRESRNSWIFFMTILNTLTKKLQASWDMNGDTMFSFATIFIGLKQISTRFSILFLVDKVTVPGGLREEVLKRLLFGYVQFKRWKVCFWQILNLDWTNEKPWTDQKCWRDLPFTLHEAENREQ